jgi:hypothetical protein
MELVEKLLKFFGGHVQIYQTDKVEYSSHTANRSLDVILYKLIIPSSSTGECIAI